MNVCKQKLVPFIFTCFTAFSAFAQTTFSWANYTTNTIFSPFTAQSYSCTLIGGSFTDVALATITSSAGTGIFKSSTPKYSTSTNPFTGASCSTSPNGLFLSVDWTNAISFVTITLSFDGGVNGVCGPVAFSIYDINDDGFGSWNDAVAVSAVNSAGTAISVSKTADCNGSTGSGTTVIFDANSSSSCTCYGNNNVSIGTASTIIKTVTIKYYSTTTPSSYNVSPQYIVLSNVTTGGFGCASIVLPVELLSFTGKCSAAKNIFNWSTATEQNNAYFTLEKSKDGEVFETFAKIKGSGNSSKVVNYMYTVEEEDNSTNKYYRLSQTDINGKSQILKLIYLNCVDVIGNLKLYPNPATNEIKINFESALESEFTINITDMLGRLLKTTTCFTSDNINESTINIADLAAGNYHAIVSNKDGTRPQILKFIKSID